MSILGRALRAIQGLAIRYEREELKPRIGVAPFLSGDIFLSLADCCLLKGEACPIFLSDKRTELVTFIECGLESSPNGLELAERSKVVLVHNGDSALSEKSISAYASLPVKCFAVNTERIENLVEPLPLGIENASLRRNGSLHYYNALNLKVRRSRRENLVLVSFREQTHLAYRSKVSAQFKAAGYDNMKLGVSKYRQILQSSMYVISPRGNGIDCHRTWEAIYHGTVPVIERRFYLFDHLNLPVLVVDSYADFLDMGREELIEIYEKIAATGDYEAKLLFWIARIFGGKDPSGPISR